MRFDSNDAEIDMNTTFYNLELVLRGDGAGFEPTMSVLEAEKILVCLCFICAFFLYYYYSIIFPSLFFFFVFIISNPLLHSITTLAN
jgi:hypothetical protein